MVNIAVLLSVSAVILQSATGNASLDLLTSLVSALGPMGFVMWLVYRTTNHTIPRLAKNFEEALDRQRMDFKEIISNQRADFARELERERDISKDQMARVFKSIENQIIRKKPTDDT
jgi:hypothetical protein